MDNKIKINKKNFAFYEYAAIAAVLLLPAAGIYVAIKDTQIVSIVAPYIPLIVGFIAANALTFGIVGGVLALIALVILISYLVAGRDKLTEEKANWPLPLALIIAAFKTLTNPINQVKNNLSEKKAEPVDDSLENNMVGHNFAIDGSEVSSELTDYGDFDDYINEETPKPDGNKGIENLIEKSQLNNEAENFTYINYISNSDESTNNLTSENLEKLQSELHNNLSNTLNQEFDQFFIEEINAKIKDKNPDEQITILNEQISQQEEKLASYKKQGNSTLKKNQLFTNRISTLKKQLEELKKLIETSKTDSIESHDSDQNLSNISDARNDETLKEYASDSNSKSSIKLKFYRLSQPMISSSLLPTGDGDAGRVKKEDKDENNKEVNYPIIP